MTQHINKNILIVYDSAAFGSNIFDLVKHINSQPIDTIQVLDWYSFEWYILSQRELNVYIDPKTLGCDAESIEQYATEYIESRCRYTKSKIHPCITKSSRCTACAKIDCVLRHNVLIPDLKFVNNQTTNYFGR